MASRIHLTEMNNFEPPFQTRDTCLAAMLNRSSRMNVTHCKPEWDHYSEMCWAPTPAGVTAITSCPDDGFLNPNQFATRQCLANGTWFVNYTFDDKPYTNYENCFLPDDPSAADDLKKLVSNKIIVLLRSLDGYTRLYLLLHVVSIAVLLAAMIISAAVVIKLKQRRPMTYSYIALSIAAAALLVNNAVTVSVSAIDDATNVFKCRLAKSLVLVSHILFYECIFGYFYMCIVSILQIPIRTLLLKLKIAAAVTLAILLVLAEQFAEIVSYRSKYCGFRTLQSKYHWLTTAPRLLLILSNMCLDCVTIFGTFYLKQPHLEKDRLLRDIRQKATCAMMLVLYNISLEILLILVHTEAYMHYSDLPVNSYLHAYSLAVAIQGIVFTVLMCFMDLEVLAMVGLPRKCSAVDHKTTGNEQQAVQMYSMAKWHSDADISSMYDLENHAAPDMEAPPSHVTRVELIFHTARPEDSIDAQTRVYESKLYRGPRK
ncbi:unnamed protein product [Candidula unifasciata]|uniref:G-protein coupled receptors family 2 profile 1 domain-containing protein n=1 Tax=Candidula unifasciata TaxID=100452 RepID=A0A8S3ZTV3_9EUPU|nr:unnamed protein product [Candidula unifasciata]